MNAQSNMYELKAERRTDFKRSALRGLRQQGRIPAVVYGSSMDSIPVHVDSKEIGKLARRGRTETFHLKIEGMKPIQTLIKEMEQKNGAWIHVDFQQVSDNKPIRVRVPIEYQGTPAGTKKGGIIQSQETGLEIEGLPSDLPSVFEVDISHLNVGDKLLAHEVALPDDIQLISNKDELLVSIIVPRGVDTGDGAVDAADEQPS
ncbi:50S ribosomal protein L25 [Paenibacillus profundus]|uniref:Large ribosomal subunit protein bL25 n=1 Tax=Paenibacillus profundus TaxID=1173085 RepID=A0ABS8YDK3_9BACL|nr:50S ribosomal protein L25 [Paenibacillus profundus]MCE5169726.1 50S ribosomal protein L25 [Paenibacillus profundus]